MLVATALVLALLDSESSDEPPAIAAESVNDSAPPLAGQETAASSASPELPASDQGRADPGSRLLTDSDGARKNMLAMSIRDAGHDCPEVRSAQPLAPGGEAWRAYCGELRLYWIEIDEFGRMSVEAGAYDESDFERDGGPRDRSLTIQPEPLPEAR
jgi:hypothetical protein